MLGGLFGRVIHDTDFIVQPDLLPRTREFSQIHDPNLDQWGNELRKLAIKFIDGTLRQISRPERRAKRLPFFLEFGGLRIDGRWTARNPAERGAGIPQKAR